MKKKYILITIVFGLFLTGNLMAQLPNYVPTNGLVGWWPFNGNANDQSGNGNNGTVNGAIFSSDRNSLPSSACSLYGTNDYIEISTSNGQFDSQQYTFSYWFRSNQLATSTSGGINVNPAIISRLNSGGPSAVNPNWIDNFVVYEIGGSNHFNAPKNYGATGANTTLGNVWRNIVFCIRNDSTITYLNGNKISSVLNVGLINFQSYPIRIGRSKYTYWKDLSGEIDDFGYWNRALTSQEILGLYNGVAPCTNPTATISPQGSTTFCQGSSVNLNASTGSNYTYEWYKDGQLITSATTSVYQAISSGNYTVKVIDGACNSTSTATTVTVNPLPTASISYTGSPWCTTALVQSVTQTGISGGTYSSTAGLSINPTTGSITPNNSTAGTYTVTYTIAAAGGCSAVTATSNVTITAAPTASISYTGSPWCKTAGVQSVTQTGTTGGTYSSTPGLTINSTTGAINPSSSSAGTYTVTYAIAAAGGCSAVTATSNVIITAAPTASISYTGSNLCTSAPLQSVTQTGTTGGTYSSTPGLTINPTTGTITPSSSNAGTYTITYTIAASGGCSAVMATSNVTITAIPSAIINANGATTFCQGNSVVLNATSGNGLTYQWKNNNANITGATAASYTSNASGSYSVAVTNSFNCNATSSQIVVTVNPLPNVTLSGLNSITNYHTASQTLTANPSGGTYMGPGVTNNLFNPTTAGLGMKNVSYDYTNVSGCSGKATLSTMVFDTLGVVCTTYDTITTNVYDTTYVTITDTTYTTIYDTTYITISDTVYTTVTDTLIINTTLSLPSPNNENTILIYPNPASDHITIDNGNYTAMAGYSIKIKNNAGQDVFQSAINQAQFYVDLSTWTGRGLYFVHLYDSQNNTVTVRKIVLQ